MTTSDTFEELVCVYCGEEGEVDSPIEDWVISPPVSGYDFKQEPMHGACASRAAMNLVM